MIWLAVVLLLFLGLLLRDSLRSFAFGTFVAALLYLAALNLVNPDALIARENIRRFQNGAELDAYYLTYLSSDATPTIAAMWPTLDAASREALTPNLRYQLWSLQRKETSWPSWHLGRSQARTALEGLGLTPYEDIVGD
jgi:hypothetical protein